MPYCPNCGTQNSDTAKFCINCGAAIQIPASEQKPTSQTSTPPPLTQAQSIGERVSFTASNGKIYTGTIKEIQGEQYRIKYDSYDFETWLGKNQFTFITGNTSTSTYSAISQNRTPGPAFTGTSSSVTSFVSSPGFWGSIAIIIGFFIDWISYGGGYGFTGLNYLTGSIETMGRGGDQEWKVIAILICMVIIIISPVVCLLYYFGAGVGKGVFSFFKTLPLIAFAGWLALVLSDTNGGFDPGDLFKIFGIGVYLTLAGSILLLASGSKKR